ncbi:MULTISPECIES: nuclear transport factor 2 family protein [unclassified Pseudonocardia]|uniref:YybH family protein n=1 Tax=unclassified Pseudonocardia TaxID=2619320 RepID=UPI001CF6D8D7|nr:MULTISPECIES: nuclear transport factor 2 family protein [unclassified Pseudonocardia]
MTITHPAQIHDAFETAVNAGDVDALLALYDTERGVVVEFDGSETTGPDALRTSFEAMTATIRRLEGTDRKLVVADDVALTSASWTAEIVLPDGSVVTQQGTTAEVSRRRPDGSWAVVIDDPLFV